MPIVNLKNLIGVIQEFCYSRGYEFKISYFAQQFAYEIQDDLEAKAINKDLFNNKLRKHRYFLASNDIRIQEFSNELIEYISMHLGYISQKQYLHNILVRFKDFVEDVGYHVFDNGVFEENGRTLLQGVLTERGFREAQMAGGQSDILIPSEKTIIETKIWNGKQGFEDGILELCAYLKSQRYKTGYYIVFDFNKSPCIVRKENGDVFKVKEQGCDINIIFISGKPVNPSSIGKAKRKAN